MLDENSVNPITGVEDVLRTYNAVTGVSIYKGRVLVSIGVRAEQVKELATTLKIAGFRQDEITVHGSTKWRSTQFWRDDCSDLYAPIIIHWEKENE